MMGEDTSALLTQAWEQLDAMCGKVGLSRSQPMPQGQGEIAPPEGSALWSAPYACLLLWPCPASDADSIEAAAAKGQAWFDEVLVQSERHTRGRPVDGYLVLALPSAPGSEAREDVRRLELSSQVCRKHLIWPSSPEEPDHEPGRWRRVADVTVLGLPDAPAAPGPEPQWPVLDKEARVLWDDLMSLGTTATVLQDENS